MLPSLAGGKLFRLYIQSEHPRALGFSLGKALPA